MRTSFIVIFNLQYTCANQFTVCFPVVYPLCHACYLHTSERGFPQGQLCSISIGLVSVRKYTENSRL